MAEHSPLHLKAIFREHRNGTYSVRTEGVSKLSVEGEDFKDVMLQLVRTVNLLKKVNELPAEFELKAHLKVHFE